MRFSYSPSKVLVVCVLSPVYCSNCETGFSRVFFCRGMSGKVLNCRGMSREVCWSRKC